MSRGSALGAIALAADDWLRKGSSKLDSVKPGSEEAYYMVAAYCFDLVRKLEYVYLATRPFALQTDPALAAKIRKHNEELDKAGQTWKAIAQKAEEIMLRLYREIGDEPKQLLNLVAGRESYPGEP